MIDDLGPVPGPELFGLDEGAVRAAGADWCDAIREAMTGDGAGGEAWGRSTLLMTGVLMGDHLEAHGLGDNLRSAEAVAAYVWYTIGIVAQTAPMEELRLSPAEITNPERRDAAVAILTMTAHVLRHGPNLTDEQTAGLPPGALGARLESPARPIPVPYRPLINRYKLTEAIKALGIGLRLNVLKGGRHMSDVGAAELTGVLAGVLMHTLFSLDPDEDREDFVRSFHGWTSSFGSEFAAAGDARGHADALLGALGLNSMWTAHMMQEAADARTNLRVGPNAQPGTVLLASKLIMTGGQMAGGVASTRMLPGYSYPEIAKNLRDYADILDRMAVVHGPDAEPKGTGL